MRIPYERSGLSPPVIYIYCEGKGGEGRRWVSVEEYVKIGQDSRGGRGGVTRIP